MPDITEKNVTGNSRNSSTWRQLAWFIGLYCAGLLATAAVAYFFRALLRFT